MVGSIGTNFIGSMISLADSNLALGKLENAKTKLSTKESLQEFEGVFLGQLFQFMSSTVDVDSNFGGGFAEETMRSYLTDQYGMIMAKSGGVGIADSLQKTMADFNNVDNEAAKTITAVKAYGKIYNFNN